jgi:alkanesulfonate monooxygenase SsuD/methylene tetrahydromethanopterin reductase-like flavin-dependent oxidoreductase (luciferase family)
MWHWLRLAEDYAMADILTGGRVIFGVGRGCHTREVERFGAPLLDPNANREMFGEGVELLFKAFAGEPFSHQGKYDPARGAVSRLHLEGDHLGAGAAAAAGRMLAADPERLRARLRFMAKDVVENHRLAGPRSSRGRDRPADALASVLH